MVVGEAPLANVNAPIGQIPSPHTALLPGYVHLEIVEDAQLPTTQGSQQSPTEEIYVSSPDTVVPPPALAVDNVTEHHDGDVTCEEEEMDDEEGPWGEETETEGEEDYDALSLVDSMTNGHSPLQPPAKVVYNNHDNHIHANNGHSEQNHTPVITDLSDTDGDLTSLEEGEYDFGYTPTAGDTQTPIPSQLCLVSATVTGFTTEKSNKSPATDKQASSVAAGHPDIVFIVELTWSDGRVNVITRTYTDFCRLQYYLINEFVDVPANESPARLNIYLPVRRDVLPEDSFAQAHAEPQDSILLAESRELLLNQYVQELIKLPPKISASPTALTFFESRNSDPVPYHETVDTSRVNVTDQYVLCWI